MSAVTLRLGRFDAERRWRPPDLATLPGIADPHADGVVEAMDECLAVLCDPDDVLVTHRPLPDSFVETMAGAGIGFVPWLASFAGNGADPDGWEEGTGALGSVLGASRLAPYAWLPETVELARQLRAQPPPPPIDVVRAVNSKSWSNQVVAELGLPGIATVVRSPEELGEAAAALDGNRVLVKDPFGVAGRGCLEVTSPKALRAVVRTLAAQTSAGARTELLVQRLLPARASFSAHLDVAADGTTTWQGVVATDGRGFGYAGSRPASPDLTTRLQGADYHLTVTAVATRLAAAGYHGPVCVDSLLLEDGTVVPVLEINARLSMGRLCLELDRRAQPDGLRTRIGQRDLAVPSDDGRDRGRILPPGSHAALVDALQRAGALHRQGTPGVLPLTANTLLSPRGRLVHAVVAPTDTQAAALERTLDACLADVDLLPAGAAARVA